MTDVGMHNLGEGLKHLVSLQNLSLMFAQNNNITNAGLNTIIESLKGRTCLQDIKLIFFKYLSLTELVS